MIRALFFDLDGTLLNSQKKLSPAVYGALKGCRERGIGLFVATARPPLLDRQLNWTRRESELFAGGSFLNGACEVIAGRTDYHPLSQMVVAHCVAQVSGYPGLNIALQMEGECHAFNHPPADWACPAWGFRREDALPITPDCAVRTVKILIYYENIVDSVTQIPGDLAEALRTFCAGRAQFYLTDGGKVIQITDIQATKYRGVERLRTALGLNRGEVAVFGDDMNDLEMLAGYPNSVAMGNACVEARSAARLVTGCNDGSGITDALERLLHIL